MSLILSSVLAYESATIWTTDTNGNPKTDFTPEEIVYIHGQGFIFNADVAIDVTRPDGAIESGSETTNIYGEFVYEYDLDGIEGLYTVNAFDGTNSAQTTFTDAAVWTTDGIAQQKNSFSCNEVVGLDGDGLTASTTLNYDVCNATGGNTCSPGNTVKSGTVDTDSNGDIVFKIIWTIPQFYSYAGQHKVYVYDDPKKTKTFSVTCGCVDNDGDGYYNYDPDSCPAGDDCDDTDPSVYPGATEICNNLIDDDCDGDTDCDDSDCVSNPNCAVCGNGIVEGTEQCDPGINNPNDCCNANCMFESNTYTCRAASGICDIAEKCSGSSSNCPPDQVQPNTYECRASAGVCDAAEYCDGSSKTCPTNIHEPQGTDCGICAACDALGNCNVFDETQDTDCPLCQECSAINTCSNAIDGTDPKNDCGTGCQRCVDGSCQDYDAACSPPYPIWSDYETQNVFCPYCQVGICGWQRTDSQCVDDVCDDQPDYQEYCGPYVAYDDNTACWTTGLEHCSMKCGAECDQNYVKIIKKRCSSALAGNYYCVGSTSYQNPEYDTCNDNCEWDDCKTKIVTENDPRCTCSLTNIESCFNRPSPSSWFNFNSPPSRPLFNLPKFDFSSFFTSFNFP